MGSGAFWGSFVHSVGAAWPPPLPDFENFQKAVLKIWPPLRVYILGMFKHTEASPKGHVARTGEPSVVLALVPWLLPVKQKSNQPCCLVWRGSNALEQQTLSLVGLLRSLWFPARQWLCPPR